MNNIKQIIFSNGETKELNYEQVRERFLPMVIKEMKKANSKFIYNAVEEEDFMQIMEIELWRAFEQYDPSTGYCFSTYLYPKLQKGIRNATYHKYSQKNQGTVLSMSAPRGEDDLKLEDLFSVDDTSVDGLVYKELTQIILKNTTDEEKEMLYSLMNKKEFSVQDYADKYNITRQAANQRIVKLKKKLQKVISSEYLEIV